jgi:hypothetical protein
LTQASDTGLARRRRRWAAAAEAARRRAAAAKRRLQGPEDGDHRQTSAVLRDFIADGQSERVTLGELADALGDRAFGFLILLFGLPNLVPIALPGLSTVLGAPLLILSLQLAWGMPRPWFPKKFADASLKRSDMVAVLDRAIPYMQRVERLLKPRLAGVFDGMGERLIGVFISLLAVTLVLPIPFGNWLPAFAACVIALALIERDGAAALAGVFIGLVSLIIAWSIVFGMAKGLLYLLETWFVSED